MIRSYSSPAANELKFGLCEYDYAGGHRGEPYDVVVSELHGLPMPAHAEIVLEGEMIENVKAKEGPFGEFTGYYASSPSEQPVVEVKRVYYRNDPILGIASPMRPPSDFSFSKCVMKAGMIWDEVERAGLSGVTGVWVHEFGGARMFNVIAIKQAYPGHATQAGLLAAGCQSASYLGRFVVVVDDDVDPTDLFDVMWAMCTRCDPAVDIDFVRRAWSGPLDFPGSHARARSSRARSRKNSPTSSARSDARKQRIANRQHSLFATYYLLSATRYSPFRQPEQRAHHHARPIRRIAPRARRRQPHSRQRRHHRCFRTYQRAQPEGSEPLLHLPASRVGAGRAVRHPGDDARFRSGGADATAPLQRDGDPRRDL